MHTLTTLYKIYLSNPSVTTDTRKINQGDLFFALKGPNFNGNLFAQQALDAGAVAVIIDEDQNIADDRLFLVEDSLKTLQELAIIHREQFSIPFIGITGSNGKTTTKELIRDVLSTKFKVSATRGNLNNHIGVPLTILEIEKDTDIAIIEMGANHLNEIQDLCKICQPTHGYITNFGKAHLEGFGSLENVILGKSELYEFLKHNSGTTFINSNDSIQNEKSTGIKSFTFGKENSNVYIEDYTVDNTVILKWNNLEISSQLFGSYNFMNASAAVAVGEYFEVENKSIQKAISAYSPTMNRSEKKVTARNTLILDAYNANPTSMALSIQDFLKFKNQALTLILADMFELGAYAKQEHQQIIDLIKGSGVNCDVYLAGELFYATNTPASWIKFKTTKELSDYLEINAVRNHNILLKGSRGMKLESLEKFL